MNFAGRIGAESPERGVQARAGRLADMKVMDTFVTPAGLRIPKRIALRSHVELDATDDTLDASVYHGMKESSQTERYLRSQSSLNGRLKPKTKRHDGTSNYV